MNNYVYISGIEIYNKLKKLLATGIKFSEDIKGSYFCIYAKSKILALKIYGTWYVNLDNWSISSPEVLYANKIRAITPGSYALKAFKESLKGSRFNYSSLFPKLKPEVNRLLKSAYNSGTLYAKPGFYNQTLWHYDLNSAFAYAFLNADVPVGIPEIHNGYLAPDGVHLHVYYMDLNVEYNSHDIFPYLVNSGDINKMPSEIIVNTGLQSLYKVLTETEFEDLKKDYTVYDNCIYTLRFKKKKGIFNSFVNRFYKLKNETDGDSRIIYKTILASLAGKLAQEIKDYRLPRGISDFGLIEYETFRKKQEDIEYTIPSVSIFIVDYVRKIIRDVIREIGYKNVILVDTDGFISTKKLDIPLSNEIGGWKVKEYENAIINGKRSYFYTENGEFHSSISGLGDIHDDSNNKLTYQLVEKIYKLKDHIPISKKVTYCGEEKYINMNIRIGEEKK